MSLCMALFFDVFDPWDIENEEWLYILDGFPNLFFLGEERLHLTKVAA